jgi:hypothetical protein
MFTAVHESGFDAVDGSSTGTRVPLSAARELRGFSPPWGCLASARRDRGAKLIGRKTEMRARGERRAGEMLREMATKGERVN